MTEMWTVRADAEPAAGARYAASGKDARRRGWPRWSGTGRRPRRCGEPSRLRPGSGASRGPGTSRGPTASWSSSHSTGRAPAPRDAVLDLADLLGDVDVDRRSPASAASARSIGLGAPRAGECRRHADRRVGHAGGRRRSVDAAERSHRRHGRSAAAPRSAACPPKPRAGRRTPAAASARSRLSSAAASTRLRHVARSA